MDKSVKSLNKLTLSDAIKTKRLQEFIGLQVENNNPAISKENFDHLIKQAVTKPQQQDQTSGSLVRGGSSGKKTR